MPTKTTETFLYAPGSLVKTRKEIYSMDPHMRLQAGTVGIVLSGPRENYNHHCQVQFTGISNAWWVNYAEIEPHL
jgi:hypothetical protein